jgi:hypothetical protein
MAASRPKNSPVVGDRLPGQQTPEHHQRFVGTPAAGPRVDAVDLELVAVLATHAHAELEPTREQPRHVRELARHAHRVAQGQQVEPDPGRQTVVGGQGGSRVDEPVEAEAVVEADVVADLQEVQLRVGRRPDHRSCARGSGLDEGRG